MSVGCFMSLTASEQLPQATDTNETHRCCHIAEPASNVCLLTFMGLNLY